MRRRMRKRSGFFAQSETMARVGPPRFFSNLWRNREGNASWLSHWWIGYGSWNKARVDYVGGSGAGEDYFSSATRGEWVICERHVNERTRR